MTMRRKCNAAMAAVAAVIFGLGAWGGAPDEARAAKDTLVIAIPGTAYAHGSGSINML